MINRDALLHKIRSLMAKTVDNGATEGEMLAALDKARAMIDAYEVTDEELQLTKEEGAVLHNDEGRDKHEIRRWLASAVAVFTECQVWRVGKKLVFCGMKSDTELASWLLDSLQVFVQGELANHLMCSLAERGERRRIIQGFVLGCCSRISSRLRKLAKKPIVASDNSKALVVVKAAAIAEKMKAEGIHLGTARRGRRSYDSASYGAGQAAGDRASFNRPLGGGFRQISAS